MSAYPRWLLLELAADASEDSTHEAQPKELAMNASPCPHNRAAPKKPARVFSGGKEGKNMSELIRRNQGLVLSVARKFAVHHPIEDLVQEGNLGLMRAAEDYDPKRAAWTTYARWWIFAHVVRYARRSKAVHNPSSLDFQAVTVFSLDAPELGFDSGESLLDHMESTAAQPDELVQRQEIAQQVRDTLRRLRDRLDGMPRAIVEQRLMRDPPATLDEVGQQFSVSRERVRQVEIKVRTLLRQHLAPIAAEANHVF